MEFIIWDQLVGASGDGFTVKCPHCGTEVEEWGELMDLFYATIEEPRLECGECHAVTALTKLDYDQTCAIGRFTITVTDVEVFPGVTGRIEKTPGFKRLEEFLGVELAVARYHV